MSELEITLLLGYLLLFGYAAWFFWKVMSTVQSWIDDAIDK